MTRKGPREWSGTRFEVADLWTSHSRIHSPQWGVFILPLDLILPIPLSGTYSPHSTLLRFAPLSLPLNTSHGDDYSTVVTLRVVQVDEVSSRSFIKKFHYEFPTNFSVCDSIQTLNFRALVRLVSRSFWREKFEKGLWISKFETLPNVWNSNGLSFKRLRFNALNGRLRTAWMPRRWEF